MGSSSSLIYKYSFPHILLSRTVFLFITKCYILMLYPIYLKCFNILTDLYLFLFSNSILSLYNMCKLAFGLQHADLVKGQRHIRVHSNMWKLAWKKVYISPVLAVMNTSYTFVKFCLVPPISLAQNVCPRSTTHSPYKLEPYLLGGDLISSAVLVSNISIISSWLPQLRDVTML